jgi:hypothetical protein
MRYWFYCLVILSGTTFNVQAADFYTDAAVMANFIELGETTEYRPWTVRAKVGYLIDPRWAVEAHLATGVYKDEMDDQKYGIRNLSGIFVRYGTASYRHFRAYLSAGYAYANLDITDATGNRYEEFNDYAFAVGLEENLETFKNVSFTIEYVRYIDSSEDDIVISGITMGFRAPIRF